MVMLGLAAMNKLRSSKERPDGKWSKTRRWLGYSALVGTGFGIVGGVVGGNLAWHDAQPVKQGISVSAGKQEVTNIDLTIEKQCNTGYSARGTSAAKFSLEVLGIKDVAWKQVTVQEDTQTEFCFENKQVHVAVDKQAHHATVKLDAQDIVADTRLAPNSLQIKTDANMLQALGDGIAKVYASTPFIQDVSFIKDAGNGLDAQTTAMVNSAITVGLKSVATNCTPQVWGEVAPAFDHDLASQIAVGMHALDPSWGPDNIDVLIGGAATPADNAKQMVAKTSTVDDAYAKLQQVLSKNNTLSVDQGSLGKCEVPDSLRQAATQGGN